MFKRLTESETDVVSIIVDGAPLSARRGDSVAAALLLAGMAACRRSAVSGRPRGPFCLMGACFECLVRVDAAANRQGCLITVADGMVIETGMSDEEQNR